MMHVHSGWNMGSPHCGTPFCFDFDLGPDPKYVVEMTNIVGLDNRENKSGIHTTNMARPTEEAGEAPERWHIRQSAPVEDSTLY